MSHLYTSNPAYTTYKTERLSFGGIPEQRDGTTTKDQRLVNCSIETTHDGTGSPQKTFIVQRAGLAYQNSTATATGRGIYYYNNGVFSVVGGNLYLNGAVLQALSNTTGTVGFVEFESDLNIKYLVVLDGISGWVVDSTNTVTKITAAAFPSPHIVHAAFIDGYLCLAKVGTADIYNSDLNNPLGWTAGNFISAEMYPDNIVSLVKQTNYIIALGSQTVEYFYDAGNSPGTPFAKNQSAFHQLGTASADSTLVYEERVIFVGQTGLGGRTIWALNAFQPSEISIEPVRQALDAEGTNIVNAVAFGVRIKGHAFYVLNLTSRTWVYDFKEQMWHEWADSTGLAKFQCDRATDHPSGSPYFLDRTQGYVYKMVAGTSTDSISPAATANVTMIATTGKFDFASINRKFISRLSLIGDVPNGNNTTSCTLSWSDDDYQTWSTPRTLIIGNTMTYLTQLGYFRRRAFQLIYSQPYPLRLEGIEVDINMGGR